MITQDAFMIINTCIIFGSLYHLILILYKKVSFSYYKKGKAKIKHIEVGDEADVNLYGGKGKPLKRIKINYSYIVKGYEYLGTKIGVLDGLFLMSNFETKMCSTLRHSYETNKEIDIWYKEDSPWVSICCNKINVYTDKIVLLFITLVVTIFLEILFVLGEPQNPSLIYINVLLVTLYILLERLSVWVDARKIKSNRRKLNKSKGSD